MKIKYSEPERIEIERQIEVDDFKHEYYLDIIYAETKIRCNPEKWEQVKDKYLIDVELNIEKDYPEAHFHQAREMDYNESIRYEGDYAYVTIPFINGDKY